MVLTPLTMSHNSAETAYIIDDYSYGFALRCQMRVWLEYRQGYGYRMVTQTSNPKKPGLVWNKPKAGVYHALLVLCLDDEQHICCDGLSIYHDRAELDAYEATYSPVFDERAWAILSTMKVWLDAYEAKKAAREHAAANPV